MTYKEQLYPWHLICHRSNLKQHVMGRFRRRSDAEGHLQVLRRLMPDLTFTIIFDLNTEATNLEETVS